MVNEIGKFHRPNLFSIPIKNPQNLDFHKSAVSTKNNFCGKF